MLAIKTIFVLESTKMLLKISILQKSSDVRS